jgi:hypothetical protein
LISAATLAGIGSSSSAEVRSVGQKRYSHAEAITTAPGDGDAVLKRDVLSRRRLAKLAEKFRKLVMSSGTAAMNKRP